MKNSSLTTVSLLKQLSKDESHVLSFYSLKRERKDISYKDIYLNAQNFAEDLRESGVEAGDRVVIILPTDVDWFTAFFGAQISGAVPVCIYPPLGISNLENWKNHTLEMLKVADTSFIVSKGSVALFLNNVNTRDKLELTVFDMDVFKVQKSNEFPSYAINDVSFMQFSSGTTGFPKLAMITHDNVMSNVEGISLGLNQEKITCVSWLPLYHDMGLVGAFFGSMYTQAHLCLIAPQDFLRKPALWLQAMSEFKANVTVAPNFAYGLCAKRVKAQELEELDLSSMKVALCGAEMINKKTIDLFCVTMEKTNFNSNAITPVYGLSEATLAVSFSKVESGVKWKRVDPDHLLNDDVSDNNTGEYFCSLGKPLKNTEVMIANKKGELLGHDRVGHIMVKGPGIMKGYFNNYKASTSIMRGEFLDTGDRGFISNGELYVCGRYKETIIINGKNYAPQTLESSLEDISGVRTGRAVAASVFDEKVNSERLIVFTEVKENVDMAYIKAEIKTSMKRFGLSCNDVILLPAKTIPRTSSGKIRRIELIKRWRDGTLLDEVNKNYTFSDLKLLVSFIKIKLASSLRRIIS